MDASLKESSQHVVDGLSIDAISGAPILPEQVLLVHDLRPGLADYLKRQYPSLRADDCVDRASVHGLLRQYILALLKEDKGELTSLETEVADSIASSDTLTENTETEYDENETLGSKVSDMVASFGGSWSFIIGFATLLAIWMAINVMLGQQNAFDAYPFILLNLVLSTIAAFQAPVIMMSQRRQEAKDRLRAANDYQVNLKAELEIRRLHEKLDSLIPRLEDRIAVSGRFARVSGRNNRTALRAERKQPKTPHTN